MSQNQLASVLFGVIGVYIVVSQVPHLLFNAAMLLQWKSLAADSSSGISQQSMVFWSIATMMLSVLVGLALVFLRQRIAGALFPSAGVTINLPELHAVALSVLGVYFVVESIQVSRPPGSLWVAVVQAIVGLGLFLGARTIADLWSKFRDATGPIKYG